MSESEVITVCSICKKASPLVSPCHFCEKIICPKHAHYLPTEDVTIRGISHDVARVCPDCYPKSLLRRAR